jgi:hypothetical protein
VWEGWTIFTTINGLGGVWLAAGGARGQARRGRAGVGCSFPEASGALVDGGSKRGRRVASTRGGPSIRRREVWLLAGLSCIANSQHDGSGLGGLRIKTSRSARRRAESNWQWVLSYSRAIRVKTKLGDRGVERANRVGPRASRAGRERRQEGARDLIVAADGQPASVVPRGRSGTDGAAMEAREDGSVRREQRAWPGEVEIS